MFIDPGLVIVWVCGNVDGGELGDSVSGVPVAEASSAEMGVFLASCLSLARRLCSRLCQVCRWQ